MKTVLRGLYSLVLRLAIPAYLARLWWRGRREPPYRQHIGERFGRYGPAPAPAEGETLWVHAVSLGETRAATALIEALRAARPGAAILLTHGTATGREAGAQWLAAHPPAGPSRNAQVWLPYDTPGATRRFLARFQPAVGILMETEVWPNLMQAARRAGVPMVLANARLSQRSFERGQRVEALLRPAMQALSLVLAQTRDDAQRLRDAGAPTPQICGNLKFDATPSPALLDLGATWRATARRAVVLAASTREGEELPLLEAWRAQPEPRPRLLIVPRHPQRFDEVARAVEAAGFSLSRRSTWRSAGDAAADAGPDAVAQRAEVWLGDSVGEMPAYYALADVALLGGSFARLGGQNLIEAAACGCPVVMGPHTWNFAEAAEQAARAGAALRMDSLREAVPRAVALTASAERTPMSRAAEAFAAQHRGAARRMAREIVALLPPS